MNVSTITYMTEEVVIPPAITSLVDMFNVTNSSLSHDTLDDETQPVSASLASTRFVVQTIVTPIVVTIGLLGNLLNILVLVQPNMRTSTNVYLLTLAMADSIYLIFSFTLSFVGCRRRDLSYAAYAFNTYGRTISDTAGNIAVWIIVIFTVERYVAVCHPMHGKIWCTVRRAKMFSLLAALFCLANTMPGFFELEIVQGANGPRCQYTQFASSRSYELGYTWWYVTIFTFVPFIFLLIFNSLLIYTLVHAARDRELMLAGGGGGGGGGGGKGDRRKTKRECCSWTSFKQMMCRCRGIQEDEDSDVREGGGGGGGGREGDRGKGDGGGRRRTHRQCCSRTSFRHWMCLCCVGQEDEDRDDREEGEGGDRSENKRTCCLCLTFKQRMCLCCAIQEDEADELRGGREESGGGDSSENRPRTCCLCPRFKQRICLCCRRGEEETSDVVPHSRVQCARASSSCCGDSGSEYRADTEGASSDCYSYVRSEKLTCGVGCNGAASLVDNEPACGCFPMISNARCASALRKTIIVENGNAQDLGNGDCHTNHENSTYCSKDKGEQTRGDTLSSEVHLDQNGGTKCTVHRQSSRVKSLSSRRASTAHSNVTSSPSVSPRMRDALRNSRKSREQNKVTLMLTVIVIIFLLCQLPWTVLYVYRAYLSAHNMSAAGSDAIKIAGNVVNLLAQINASGNFYLYSFFSKKFRRTLARLFLFWKAGFSSNVSTAL